ncbi:hypothetical protein RA16_06890 [Levilactobacillus brevis]|nr:hypothetical protein RA16_06890 [Levilactobacillus brevis]
MGQMVNTKFGLVSCTEARCLGELERQLKDGQWKRKNPQQPVKPRITVWRKNGLVTRSVNEHNINKTWRR